MRAPMVWNTLLLRFHCVSSSLGFMMQKLGLNHSYGLNLPENVCGLYNCF